MARRRTARTRQSRWDPLTSGYADLSSPEWLDRVPAGFWDDPHNHTRYMTWISDKLQIQEPEDWYRVRSTDFAKNHGTGFLDHYESPGSWINAIRAWNPKFEFHEWLFPRVPTGFCDQRQNRLRYRDWLAIRLGYKKTENWYQLKQETLQSNHGGGLLTYFHDSPQQLAHDFFPDYDWKPWLFKQVSAKLLRE